MNVKNQENEGHGELSPPASHQEEQPLHRVENEPPDKKGQTLKQKRREKKLPTLTEVMESDTRRPDLRYLMVCYGIASLCCFPLGIIVCLAAKRAESAADYATTREDWHDVRRKVRITVALTIVCVVGGIICITWVLVAIYS